MHLYCRIAVALRYLIYVWIPYYSDIHVESKLHGFKLDDKSVQENLHCHLLELVSRIIRNANMLLETVGHQVDCGQKEQLQYCHLK